MNSKRNQQQLDTRLIHAGEPRPRIEGAISMPVFQSSTFEPKPGAGYHDLGYIRLSTTPNHRALNQKLSSLENAEAALVTGSGMAAISTTLLSVLSAGDHVLLQDCLYGGTHDFVTADLPSFGIEYDFIDAYDNTSWSDKLKPNTKAIYVESMTNPTLQVADLPAVVTFARQNNLISIIDNTFASPINFRPAEHGFDLSLHSGTKYLNGHSDIVAGAIIGKETLINQVKHRLDHLGGALDPHACFLLHRGMKTLALRVRQQNSNTLALAEMLAEHPAVATVNYAGLKSHPHHQRACDLFNGYGGVLSFEPEGGADVAQQVIDRVQLPANAPSLGGVETLITRPAATSHAGMSAEERIKIGISDGLIRVAVGIEAEDDLLADFSQALN